MPGLFLQRLAIIFTVDGKCPSLFSGSKPKDPQFTSNYIQTREEEEEKDESNVRPVAVQFSIEQLIASVFLCP